MDEILQKINKIVIAYESGHYKDLVEGQRILNCNLYFLMIEQIEFERLHRGAFFNSKEKSIAARTKEADELVPELYKCRKIGETGKEVLWGIRGELKAN
tara:strand:- start:135 stop:431 length:297 start_codon:yes stop_codon:yes gene_type:complete